MKAINCFIPFGEIDQTTQTVKELKKSELVNKIFILVNSLNLKPIDDCQYIFVDSMTSTSTIQKIANHADATYCLLYTKTQELQLGAYTIERLFQIAEDTKAGLLYSDYYKNINGERKNHPTIDYQKGSIRDDFDFGSLLFFNAKQIRKAIKNSTGDYLFGGLYDLRLTISRNSEIVHINEYLYSEIEVDNRKSGEKQFDYVDPKNRNVQLEMEKACTQHLIEIGAFLKPKNKKVDFSNIEFKTEASVIIPVRNRVKTIEDAIKSVLTQKTNFDFNLIIIDNHSNDGTTELIQQYSKQDSRVFHIIPERDDLGIGGCWNQGIQSEWCGKFAIQLDSDDVYETDNTIQKIVDEFYNQNCAMVIGSYTMTNFNMETIPPGLIDHKEWTETNGKNNALRINALGAPRAFFTPILRELKVPNTSYGEDYALGLRISRDYNIGRIYESIYLCRRWDENSDSSLDAIKMNQHNSYKDKIRTIELKARILKNKNEK